MKRENLELLEAEVMKIVVNRRRLGGYNSEAEDILTLSEILMRLLQHTIETLPEPKRSKKDVQGDA